MNDFDNGYDDRSRRERLESATRSADDATPLESIVVRYEDRPDRWTIAPRECSEAERTTTWLSADVRVVVDLADAR